MNLKKNVLGVDLGGTNVRAGILKNNRIQDMASVRITPDGSVNQVMNEIFSLLDTIFYSEIDAIGIGVPSVVNIEQGIVYDVQNIPSWKKVQVGRRMKERYDRPVLVNNDANCFALGEKYFGKGQKYYSMIGLIIGTGMGAGIIINDKLYAGSNSGAGEFGMVEYLDHNYEYYASGQYFDNMLNKNGEEVFQQVKAGSTKALDQFNKLGEHLGNAIKMILYTYDPECIILGGSVRLAYPYFQESMWKQIRTFAYPKSLEQFHIEISELEHSGILGAAALYYDSYQL